MLRPVQDLTAICGHTWTGEQEALVLLWRMRAVWGGQHLPAVTAQPVELKEPASAPQPGRPLLCSVDACV